MMPTRRQLIAAASAGLAVAVTGGQQRALAQTIEKPLLAKPVRIIVGFAAGGGTDVTARILAEAVRGTYASTFVVENKPGAAARLAVEYVKNAEPDGSVVLFTPDFPITVYPYSFRSLTYDPERDLTPVTTVTKSMLTYYGYCLETGEPISLRRLEARPIATLSIEAQERHERNKRLHNED